MYTIAGTNRRLSLALVLSCAVTALAQALADAQKPTPTRTLPAALDVFERSTACRLIVLPVPWRTIAVFYCTPADDENPCDIKNIDI